jgi:hypothetical protein
MDEETALTKNNQKFASLRLTVPISIVKQWGLKEGDRLDWSWKVLDGRMALVVDKSNPSCYNNMDRRTSSSEGRKQQQSSKQLRQHGNKQQKTYNQLMKLASRAAYRATKR